MSRIGLSSPMVGNEFVLPVRRPPVAVPVAPIESREFLVPAATVATDQPRASWWRGAFELMHRHSVISFALLCLLVGSSGITVAGRYQAARASATPPSTLQAKAPAIAGLNLAVPNDQLAARLQAITGQAASLTVDDQVSQISPDVIKSWLQITPSTSAPETYIRVKTASMTKSLAELAGKYEKAPINQVTVTYPDGTSAVIVNGQNGTKLTDPAGLTSQATELAKTLMDSKGLQLSTPLQPVPFQAVTPAAFNKLIEVNVTTKQMYLYDNGQLTHSYPISAGAPETPTPIGQYQIYSKLAVQDMKGFNANGTKYFQPHVHWINYFLPGGYAVHGNYWRPTSFFGNINSSHGCVSLPDDQAKVVYDWAPLGTNVITHR